MGFERVNGAFGCIAAMNFGWDKLLLYLPNVFHDTLVLFNGFIVQYLEINGLITVFKPGHDLIVCKESSFLFLFFCAWSPDQDGMPKL